MRLCDIFKTSTIHLRKYRKQLIKRQLAQYIGVAITCIMGNLATIMKTMHYSVRIDGLEYPEYLKQRNDKFKLL